MTCDSVMGCPAAAFTRMYLTAPAVAVPDTAPVAVLNDMPEGSVAGEIAKDVGEFVQDCGLSVVIPPPAAYVKVEAEYVQPLGGAAYVVSAMTSELDSTRM